MVRYDNEKGKGDHRHIKAREKPYVFTSEEALVADFLSDIEKKYEEVYNEKKHKN